MMVLVFWNSAIEHNDLEKMKKAVEVSLKSLKEGGFFISTWAFGEKTYWHDDIAATVLSTEDSKNVFNCEWIERPDFNNVKKEYLDNILSLRDWHQKRFGHININYLHAGSLIIK